MAESIQEERLERISRGQSAQMLGSEISRRIREKEDEILTRLVREYWARTITHDMLMGAVGEIAALHKLEDDLDREARQGMEAADREFKI